MTDQVLAAIDGSQFSEGVCDYAAWASLAMNAPLTFVHVVDNHSEVPEEQNLSGNLRFGARERLMKELSELDEQRAKVNREQGKLMLEAAKARALEEGVSDPITRQLNGTLVETLVELEKICGCWWWVSAVKPLIRPVVISAPTLSGWYANFTAPS
ncbi:hypothetical protein HORIV_52210 [Vreelandella olivaria]|uniref:UspA domain-containing protein n=1 Tax=Vreelandella olivaria TaxID=390919 RepID=A0ABN5X2F2_9GAMM|nr:hypothetical protein HORIV_52210 [Halomonas olivaria]